MTSLVAFGIAQLQAPNWWTAPSESWKSNKSAIRRRLEHRAYLLDTLKQIGKPVSYRALSEHTELSVHSLRNTLIPAIEDGSVIRTEVGGVIHVEAA